MSSATDFEPRRILEILAEHNVDYVLIGGIASALHGAPFPTIDLDVVPELKTANLDRLAGALRELKAVMRADDEPGGRALEWSGRNLKKWLADFRILNLETKYGYLDLIQQPAGTKGYRDLEKSATDEEIGTATVRIAALQDIIRSKQAVGRPRDLEQLPTLRQILDIQKREQEEGDDKKREGKRRPGSK